MTMVWRLLTVAAVWGTDYCATPPTHTYPTPPPPHQEQEARRADTDQLFYTPTNSLTPQQRAALVKAKLNTIVHFLWGATLAGVVDTRNLDLLRCYLAVHRTSFTVLTRYVHACTCICVAIHVCLYMQSRVDASADEKVCTPSAPYPHNSPTQSCSTELTQLQLVLGTHLYAASPNLQHTMDALQAASLPGSAYSKGLADPEKLENDLHRPVPDETSVEHNQSCAAMLLRANWTQMQIQHGARALGRVDPGMVTTAFEEDVGHVLASVVAPVGRGRGREGGGRCVVRRKERVPHGQVVSFVVEAPRSKVCC